MDDRSWFLAVGSLGAGVLAMFLDAALPSFNVDPGFYPFLGVVAGGALGRSIWKSTRNGGSSK